MNESQIIRAGDVLRLAGAGVLAQACSPADSIRIAATHFVDDVYMEQFAAIVRKLTANRYPITPAQFFRHYDAGAPEPIRGKSILFTFDDGLLSSYHAARRVLDSFGIKAIFFIPTMILDLQTPDEMRNFAAVNLYHGHKSAGTLSEAECLTMNAEHLLQLQRDGHAILAHTHSHLNLSEITSDDAVDRELRNPRLKLEGLLQAAVEGFAFPVGTERVINSFSFKAVQENYTYCFSALHGINREDTDPLLLKRDCVHPYYPLTHVRNITDGIFDPYYSIKYRLLQRRAGAFRSEERS